MKNKTLQIMTLFSWQKIYILYIMSITTGWLYHTIRNIYHIDTTQFSTFNKAW